MQKIYYTFFNMLNKKIDIENCLNMTCDERPVEHSEYP